MSNGFDASAKNYDSVFTFSEIGKAQRNRVHNYLSRNILQKERLNILELNCGTGEDALFFLKKGHQVFATDISQTMLDTAKEKCQNENIHFVQQDISTITDKTFTEQFDLIFSNFGGLNCLSRSQLDSFIKISTSLLLPTGKMILVIMPKQCLWERIYFLLKRQNKIAFRRNTNEPVQANFEGVQISTWYYNPKDIVTLAEDNYKTLAIKPIGMSIPPSYLESFFKNKKSFLKFLVRLEALLSFQFLAKYADHYLIALQKK